MNVLQAIDDPQVFRSWFSRGDWSAWRAFLAAFFGLPMDEDALAVYQRATGRTEAPEWACDEAWLICGRRSGKSFVLALIAVYLGCFRDYRPHLQPGERATVMVLAQDKRQARVIMRYAFGLLSEVPMLAALIENHTTETIELANRVSIEIHAASFRGTRGYTLAAVAADELAFWRSDDSANPDKEILNALRPGMATIPGAMLLCASSPYARRGALWDAYRRHHGVEGDPVLVWQAPTQTMNPSVPDRVIEQAYAEDAASAAAEFGGEFRTDVEGYVSREVIDDLVSAGVHERPRIPGCRYTAFVDPSGGSKDSMTLAVSHAEGEVSTLDAVRERRPPFSPESVVTEFAELLKTYGLSEVTGDRYGGEWPREAFRKAGIEYRLADRPKSDLYRDLLPMLNSARVDLLDHRRLIAQLGSLERKTSRAGKDSIDHAPGAHDDVANAVAGALLAAKPRVKREVVLPEPGGDKQVNWAGRFDEVMG